MKTIICFVLLLTISVAKDGDVYVYSYREYYEYKSVPKREPWSPFTFDYHQGGTLSMNIYLTNLVPNVIAHMFLKYPSGDSMGKEKLHMKNREKQFKIRRLLQYSKISIELELSTTAGLCTTYNIVNATYVNRDQMIDAPYNEICLKKDPCVIEVDLLNNICEVVPKPKGPTYETTTNKSTGSGTESNDQHKLKAVVYVIPSVAGCVIILAIYIIVKKHCHRNSHPVETTEFNTYATANEVVYADLSLVHGDSRPPKRDEESVYAKIIGVMKPVPR